MKKRTFLIPCFLQLLLLSQCLLMCVDSNASVDKHLWSKWQAHKPLSEDVISHKLWQEFLSRHVIKNNESIHLVDYPRLTQTDINLLNEYINQMSQIKIKNYTRPEQLAYWINLYNALTVKLIAGYYPVDSIQDIDISPGLFSVGPWRAKIIMIDDTHLSLDEILNEILRPIWNDPRIHYALSNGTIGGANLSHQAFEGHSIDAQLNQAAFEYINSLRAMQIIENKLVLSKVYDWYQEDFGDKKEDLIHHLAQYTSQEVKDKLKKIENISSYMYNWHLNTTIE